MTLQDSSHHFHTPNRACRTMRFFPNIDFIENETKLTYDIKVHTAEQIQVVRESLPILGPLARAKKILKIRITADGVIKSKFLPSDVYYDHVKIAVSRRHKRVESSGKNGEDI